MTRVTCDATDWRENAHTQEEKVLQSSDLTNTIPGRLNGSNWQCNFEVKRSKVKLTEPRTENAITRSIESLNSVKLFVITTMLWWGVRVHIATERSIANCVITYKNGLVTRTWPQVRHFGVVGFESTARKKWSACLKPGFHSNAIACVACVA